MGPTQTIVDMTGITYSWHDIVSGSKLLSVFIFEMLSV